MAEKKAVCIYTCKTNQQGTNRMLSPLVGRGREGAGGGSWRKSN